MDIQANTAQSISEAKKAEITIVESVFIFAEMALCHIISKPSIITHGKNVLINAEIAKSETESLMAITGYNLLDYVKYGDDVYLLISDNFGNTKIYRGAIRGRDVTNRLINVTAITGDGILSERIIRGNYPAQDIGQTAKEIIETYCKPLTATNVNTNTGINAPVVADRQSPLTVFEELRKNYGINYFVDFAWDVHLYISNEIEPSYYPEDGYLITLGENYINALKREQSERSPFIGIIGGGAGS